MPQYLLSIYQPDGGVPDAESMARITTDLHRLKRGAARERLVGVHRRPARPGSATVVRAGGMITDGPYLEGKEHIGGIWVITAPDVDAALRGAQGGGRDHAADRGPPVPGRPALVTR